MNQRQAALRTAAGIGASLVFSGAFMVAGMTGGIHGTAYAEQPSQTVTVDGRDYPVCEQEDCSDQPGQVGVWFNDGRAWLSLGEYSIEVTR